MIVSVCGRLSPSNFIIASNLCSFDVSAPVLRSWWSPVAVSLSIVVIDELEYDVGEIEKLM